MRNFAVVFSALCFIAACSSVNDDREAISRTLHQSLDKSGASLDINPIVVREHYAIADWSQGDRGGRVLLRHEHGDWKVLGQAGGELRDAQFLKEAGVPEQEASALANVLITAERKLPETRLALLDHYVEADVRR